MVTSLLQHERIITTHPKAKACQRMADRMITIGKEHTTQRVQKANAFIRDKAITWKLFTVLGPRYAYRPGGYTRVMHLKERRGDNAAMSILELVDREGEVRPAVVCDEQFHQQTEEWRKEYHTLQKTENKTGQIRDTMQYNSSASPSTPAVQPAPQMR